jgi:hypothetical protein
MKLAAIYLMREYAGHRIDCVLALDNPGLVLATAFGLQTMKETYYSETNDVLADHGWAEIRYRISGMRTSSRLYIPKNSVEQKCFDCCWCFLTAFAPPHHRLGIGLWTRKAMLWVFVGWRL